MTSPEEPDLAKTDLVVDAVYRGGRTGKFGDDPFPRLLGMSNQGGFRFRGDLRGRIEMLLLTSTFSDPDWPDVLDRETGVFTYYGDNKEPGRQIHETGRGGNIILERIFAFADQGAEGRCQVPPVFVFGRAGEWRDMVFLGLAVPGVASHTAAEDLVAIWRSNSGQRFQNYRSRFTVLDVPVVTRAWLDHMIAGGDAVSPLAPAAWLRWVERGVRTPLAAARTLEHRLKAEQLPQDDAGRAIISMIHEHFKGRAHDFEYCAAALAKLAIPDTISIDVTRPSRDGGRDGVGLMRIGAGAGSITVDFALEAKCYGANAVGVSEMSRLISRLRHRQFGVLVTTSTVDQQAYREIKEDGHPIVVIAARDIVELLRADGKGSPESVRAWLDAEFPRAAQA